MDVNTPEVVRGLRGKTGFSQTMARRKKKLYFTITGLNKSSVFFLRKVLSFSERRVEKETGDTLCGRAFLDETKRESFLNRKQHNELALS